MKNIKSLLVCTFILSSQFVQAEDLFNCELEKRYKAPNNSREKLEKACNLKSIDSNISMAHEQVNNYKEILAGMDKDKPSFFRKGHGQGSVKKDLYKNFNFKDLEYSAVIDTYCHQKELDHQIKTGLESQALKPSYVGYLNFQRKQYETMSGIYDAHLMKHNSYVFLKDACKSLLREGEMFSDINATRNGEERKTPEKNAGGELKVKKKTVTKQ